MWRLCVESSQELSSFASTIQIGVSAFIKVELSLFIMPLGTSLDFYWGMTKSVLGRTKGEFADAVESKIKTKCYCKAAFIV